MKYYLAQATVVKAILPVFLVNSLQATNINQSINRNLKINKLIFFYQGNN